MLKYLRLVRFQNLIIIVLTQFLMRYSIIEPIIKHFGLSLQLPFYAFVLLVISTACLAAAGYVINDYFDRKIDLINKPSEVIVGSKVNRRHAIILHVILNIVGVFIGFYLAYYVHIYLLALIYLIIAGLFWYYSTNYKRQFLIGNVIVALLTALVPLQVVMYENVMLYRVYSENAELFLGSGINIQHVLRIISWWIAAFAFYAFLTNLAREIIKDIEDFEGDNAFGRNSLPVVLGLKASKIIVVFILSITLLAIIYTYLFHVPDTFTLIYMLVAICFPVIILIYLVLKGKDKKHYSRASNL